MCNFFNVLLYSQYFVQFNVPTSETEVIKYCKQNIEVLLNIVAIKICKCTKIWKKMRKIPSDFGKIYNILTLASIICIDKPSGNCKIVSQYFIKMLFSIETPGLLTHPFLWLVMVQSHISISLYLYVFAFYLINSSLLKETIISG